MTIGEVINKLSMEMAVALGELDHLQTCRTYIQMALSIGIEHFTVDSEEIIAMWKDGQEAGRFKSIGDASRKLGLDKSDIYKVTIGRRHTVGGLMFIKTKDKELIKRA